MNGSQPGNFTSLRQRVHKGMDLLFVLLFSCAQHGWAAEREGGRSLPESRSENRSNYLICHKISPKPQTWLTNIQRLSSS
jgi:hypothetical protein